MSGRLAGALAITVCALVAFVPGALRLPHLGYPAIQTRPAGACALNVVSVSSQAQTTLRPGDKIDLPAMEPRERSAYIFDVPTDGKTFDFPVDRSGVRVSAPVAIVPLPAEYVRYFAILLFITGVWLICGILALWFGRDRGSLYAGLFLTCSAFGMGNPIESASTTAAQIAGAAFDILFCVGFFSLYLLAEELGRGGLGPRTARALRCIAIGAIAAGAVLALVNRLFVWNVGCFVPFNDAASLAFDAVVVICGLVILGRATMDKRIEDRRRAQWIFWSSAVGMVGAFFSSGLGIFRLDPTGGYAFLAVGVIPIGYSYATLRYRTFDIEFVLTRAIVSIAVIIVLGSIFVLVKLALKQFVIALDANAATVDTVLTIVLTLSFRDVEARIAGLVERTVFRHKFGAIEKIEEIAREASSYEDVGTLLVRFAGVVHSALAATGVAILVRSGQGYSVAAEAGTRMPSESIEFDDPAFVKLRTRAETLELDLVQSSIADGGILIPIAAAGRLHGALWCGPRAHGEVYDPDERRALQRAARDIAVALVAAADQARRNFVTAVASGEIEGPLARETALALRERLLWGLGAGQQEEPADRGMLPAVPLETNQR